MKTPNVKLSLRKTNLKNVSIIYYEITFRKNRKRISTGIKLINGTLKNNRIICGSKDQIGDNLLLTNGLVQIDKVIQECRNTNGEYNWDKFIVTIDIEFSNNNVNNNNEYGVLYKFREFIKYKVDEENLRKGTVQTYITTVNHLEEYENLLDTSFTFENLTKNKIEKFIKYLSSKGISDNTISKYIKNIKAFYRWLYENGIVNDIRMISTVSVKKRKISYPTFNITEIQKLWDVELETVNQNKYRDLLLILCYTGLRVSELSQINANTTNSDLSILIYHNSKTDETHTKYFPENIRELIKHYFIDNDTNIIHQKFNKMIKTVCKKAGIDHIVPVDSYVDSKLITTYKKKYELITTHCGRRTFCTLLAGNKNISISDAIELSGHGSIEMFERYVNNNTTEVINKHSNNIDELFNRKE